MKANNKSIPTNTQDKYQTRFERALINRINMLADRINEQVAEFENSSHISIMKLFFSLLDHSQEVTLLMKKDINIILVWSKIMLNEDTRNKFNNTIKLKCWDVPPISDIADLYYDLKDDKKIDHYDTSLFSEEEIIQIEARSYEKVEVK